MLAQRRRGAARPTFVILALPLPEPYVLAVPEAEWGWEVPVPDAKVAVLIDRKGVGRVWSLEGKRARLTSTFRVEVPLVDLAQSPNGFLTLPDRRGERVAMVPATNDRVTVARIRPFKPLWSAPIKPAYGLPLDWSPDGRTLLVNEDGRTRLFSAEGHERGSLPLAKPYAFDGNVAYGLAKGGIAGYDLATRRLVRRLADPEATMPLGVSPDGRWLVAGSHAGGRYRYRVWRLADGRAVGECPGSSQNLNEGFDPTFLPGGRFRLDGIKEVHALPSGRLVAKRPGWAPLGYSESGSVATRYPTASFPPLTDAPYHAWPQPDGGLLIASTRMGTFLDPTSQRVWTLDASETGGIKQAMTRDDGSLVLNGNRGVEIFPPGGRKGRFVAAPKVGNEPVESRLEPGGREAVGRPLMGEGGVRWRVDDGKVLGSTAVDRSRIPEFPGPRGAAYRAFPQIPQGTLERVGAWTIRATGRFTSRPVPTPDGKAVVIAEQLAAYGKPSDARLRMLDTATGAELRSLRTCEVSGVTLSPDGRTAALREPEGIEIRPLDGSPGRFVPDSATASIYLEWWSADRVMTLGNFPQAIDTRTARVVARWASWRDGGWALWTPEGAADGDALGLTRLFRSQGTGVVPLAQPVRRDEAWWALRPTG